MILFEGLLGNELIKRQLKNAVEENRVSHAYIIEGEKGIGKKTLAKAFAAGILKDEDRVKSGNHPDLIYVTHEKPDTISVEEIRRQVNDTVAIRPYLAENKIYIIDDAEKMTQQAQNALLKTVEEPPEYAIIILLAADESGILQTILSRCVKLKMKPLTDAQTEEYLRNNFSAAELSEERIKFISAFSEGNPGRAKEIACSEEFQRKYDNIMEICRNIRNMDAAELYLRIKLLRKISPDLKECFDILQLWYRDVMMYKVTKDINSLIFRSERTSVMDTAALSSCEGIENIMEAIEKCRRRIAANVNPELAIELMFLAMRENQG